MGTVLPYVKPRPLFSIGSRSMQRMRQVCENVAEPGLLKRGGSFGVQCSCPFVFLPHTEPSKVKLHSRVPSNCSTKRPDGFSAELLLNNAWLGKTVSFKKKRTKPQTEYCLRTL
ncbi:hypothetical protein XELAEV_18001100mg [Xenopus laevis]|uniref:Uncharacterized protein n=1 Tax=Xenopus laevis TaxID=8355 RepID=A0A974BPY3_XENLA|nr:hypothetical protein XELAEV_18001100mg [Xenopus laevis]